MNILSFLKMVLYSLARQAESSLTIVDHPKVYIGLVMLEYTGNWDSVNQHNADSNLTYKYNNRSGSIAKSARSDSHSIQDHVNTPKIGTRITNEATIKDNGTSKVRHAPFLRLDTDLTASTELKFPTD